MTSASSLLVSVLVLGKCSLGQQNPIFVEVLGSLILTPRSPQWTPRESGSGPSHLIYAQGLKSHDPPQIVQ